MLKKSGPNDIWLIGQGPSYTALCWSRSWPRISSLCEMQRQATVTEPLGSWVCANRLAQFAPLLHRTYRACTAQSQGRALPLGTAGAAPLPFAHYWNRSSKLPALLHTQLLWLHTHTQWHMHTHQHAQTYCTAAVMLRWDLMPSWLVSKTLSWKAHFWCSGGLNAFVLKGFFSL